MNENESAVFDGLDELVLPFLVDLVLLGDLLVLHQDLLRPLLFFSLDPSRVLCEKAEVLLGSGILP